MKIEQLVAPLTLCEKIPSGEFSDSAMVWTHDLGKSDFYVAIRDDVEFCRRGMVNAPALFPAPNAEEIMRQLPVGTTIHFDHELSCWMVILPDRSMCQCDNEKASYAAMRMLIEVNGWW